MKVCEQCGKLNYNDGAKFCPHCGGALTDYAAQKRQKFMRKVKIGGGLGAVALALFIGIWAFFAFEPHDILGVLEYNGTIYIHTENGYGERDDSGKGSAIYKLNADTSGYTLFAENSWFGGSAEDFVWNDILYSYGSTLNLNTGKWTRVDSSPVFSKNRFYNGYMYDYDGGTGVAIVVSPAENLYDKKLFYELPDGYTIGRGYIYIRDGYLYVHYNGNEIDRINLANPNDVVRLNEVYGREIVDNFWYYLEKRELRLDFDTGAFSGEYYETPNDFTDEATLYKISVSYDRGLSKYVQNRTAIADISFSKSNSARSTVFSDGKCYFRRGRDFYIYSLSRPNQLLKYTFKDKQTGYVLTEITGELSGNVYTFGKTGARVTPASTPNNGVGLNTASSQSTQRPATPPAVVSTPEPTPSSAVVVGNQTIDDIECLTAYYMLMNSLQKNYGDYDGDSGIVYAKLVDFEADNNPELLVIRREYGSYDYEHPRLFSAVYGYSAQGGVFEIFSNHNTAMGKYKIAKDSSGKWYLLSYFFGDGDANHNIYVDTVTDGQQMNVALYMDRAKTGINYTLGYQGTTVTYDEIMVMYPGEFCDPNKTDGAYDFLNSINVGDWNALFPVAEQYDNSTVSAPAPANGWLIQPAFDYAQIQYCPYHGFYSTSRSSGKTYTDVNGNLVIVRDGASYILDENLNIIEEHLGHGLDSPIVFFNEWSGDWEVMTGMGDWYPDWIGQNLSDFFGNEPYSGSFVSGHLDNGWIAGGVGLLRDSKIILNASQDIEDAKWLGTAYAYRKNNRWTIALDNGEEVATGLFGVKESYSQKSEKPYCFAANNGNLWGVVSIIGDTVLPFEYEDIIVIDNSRAYAKQNGKYGVIGMNWAG